MADIRPLNERRKRKCFISNVNNYEEELVLFDIAAVVGQCQKLLHILTPKTIVLIVINFEQFSSLEICIWSRKMLIAMYEM